MPFLDLFLMLSPAHCQTNATLAECGRPFTAHAVAVGSTAQAGDGGAGQAPMKRRRDSERDRPALWKASVTGRPLPFVGRAHFLIH